LSPKQTPQLSFSLSFPKQTPQLSFSLLFPPQTPHVSLDALLPPQTLQLSTVVPLKQSPSQPISEGQQQTPWASVHALGSLLHPH
jgi:hypothetical protein